MFRYVLPVLAALVLITASLIPDDAFARGRGGGGYRGGGGFHGGAARVGGVHRGGHSCRSRGWVPRRGSRLRLPRRVLSASRIRRGGGWCRSSRCRGLRCLRRLQQLLRCVRQLYQDQPSGPAGQMLRIHSMSFQFSEVSNCVADPGSDSAVMILGAFDVADNVAEATTLPRSTPATHDGLLAKSSSFDSDHSGGTVMPFLMSWWRCPITCRSTVSTAPSICRDRALDQRLDEAAVLIT